MFYSCLDTPQIRKSKVTEYKNNGAKVEVEEDGLDDIDSDDEGSGVPCTKQSDIRDAVESNLSRANQFSTHKSMSIRETEDIISNMKSVRKIIETDIEGNSPNTTQ